MWRTIIAYVLRRHGCISRKLFNQSCCWLCKWKVVWSSNGIMFTHMLPTLLHMIFNSLLGWHDDCTCLQLHMNMNMIQRMPVLFSKLTYNSCCIVLTGENDMSDVLQDSIYVDCNSDQTAGLFSTFQSNNFGLKINLWSDHHPQNEAMRLL